MVVLCRAHTVLQSLQFAVSSVPHVLQMTCIGFGTEVVCSVPHLELTLHGAADRKAKRVEMLEGPAMMLPIYGGNEKVSGRVDVVVPGGKRMEHLGVKVELKGVIGERCALTWCRCCCCPLLAVDPPLLPFACSSPMDSSVVG